MNKQRKAKKKPKTKSNVQVRDLKPGKDPKGGIEITDYGFGVSMPVTTSR